MDTLKIVSHHSSSKTNCFDYAHTHTVTLERWNIENNESFYVFIRRKEQPSLWNFEESENLEMYDATEGKLFPLEMNFVVLYIWIYPQSCMIEPSF